MVRLIGGLLGVIGMWMSRIVTNPIYDAVAFKTDIAFTGVILLAALA